MKSNFRYIFIHIFFVSLWFYGGSAFARDEEHWLCRYESTYEDKVSFSAEYQTAGKKLLGSYDELSGRRLEYQIVQNNSYGLIAIRPYSNNSNGSLTSANMGVTVIVMQKHSGIFKVSGILVGAKEEDTYYGTCSPIKNDGKNRGRHAQIQKSAYMRQDETP